MGMAKWQHIQAITRADAVAARWEAVHGKRPDDTDVDALYERFLPLQVQTVEKHSDVIAGVARDGRRPAGHAGCRSPRPPAIRARSWTWSSESPRSRDTSPT